MGLKSHVWLPPLACFSGSLSKVFLTQLALAIDIQLGCRFTLNLSEFRGLSGNFKLHAQSRPAQLVTYYLHVSIPETNFSPHKVLHWNCPNTNIILGWQILIERLDNRRTFLLYIRFCKYRNYYTVSFYFILYETGMYKRKKKRIQKRWERLRQYQEQQRKKP